VGFTSDFKRIDGGQSYSVPYFTLDGSEPTRRLAIDKTGALFSTAYLAAEQAKARALGSLPCHVYRDGDISGREKLLDHPLAQIVSRRWNPVMTAQTGRQWLAVRRDTCGTAHVRVQWYRGEPVALWPMECEVETGFDASQAIPVRYNVPVGDRFTPKGVYLPHEILVFPTVISTDGGVSGRSLAELAAEDIGLSIDLTRFYANVIQRGFHPGGYIEHEQKLSLDDVRALAEKNKVLSGTDHAGEVRIFDQGLKYHALSTSMAEADIVKQQEFILQSVARAVYVQPSKVFDYSRATYSNIESAQIAFIVDTLMPEVTAIEAEFGKILDYMGQRDTYIKFDMRGLQRGDFKSQMEGYVAGVYAGIYTRADVREWEELPYIEGTDELLQPTAYVSIDPDTGETTAYGRNAQDALAPVVEDALQRVRARLEADGDTPRTLDYARTVLRPVARAHALAGRPFDIDAVIEEIAHG
jgi:HK97 family phage portal protein